jgi:hypothetical protein
MQNKVDDAIDYALKAIELVPYYPNFRFDLATLYFQQGDLIEARIHVDTAVGLNEEGTLNESIERLIDQIIEAALNRLFSAGIPADGLFSGAPYQLVMDTVTAITGDRYSTCDIAIMGDGRGRYSIIGEKHAYWAGITESNLFYVMISDPEVPPEDQIIIMHSIHEKEESEKGEEEKPETEVKINLDTNEDLFKAIIRLCESLDTKPDKLFFVEHGMDSGEWEPEMSFSPEEYPKIMKEIDNAWFGYQVNFNLETDEGGVYGRSNPGWGVWMVIRGSKDFVEKVKTFIFHNT